MLGAIQMEQLLIISNNNIYLLTWCKAKLLRILVKLTVAVINYSRHTPYILTTVTISQCTLLNCYISGISREIICDISIISDWYIIRKEDVIW